MARGKRLSALSGGDCPSCAAAERRIRRNWRQMAVVALVLAVVSGQDKVS